MKKIIALLLSMVMVLSLFGCNSTKDPGKSTAGEVSESKNPNQGEETSNADEETQGGETEVEVPGPKDGEKVISFWCVMWEQECQDWVTKCVNTFNLREDRPYYVELTLRDNGTWGEALAAARAANIAPDILTVSLGNLPSNYKDGYILDLSELISEDAWNDVTSAASEFVSVGDAKIAYPWMLEPSVVMYYNKEMFKEAGLDPENPPKTWDEFLKACAVLNTDDCFGYDIALEYNIWGWSYTANGGYMLKDDWSGANVDKEGMTKLMEFYRALRNDGYGAETALNGQNSGVKSVAEKRSAISFSGSWGVGTIDNDYPEMKDVIGVAAAPTPDGSPFHATSGGWALCVDAKSKNPQEAAEFIEWMYGGDAAMMAEYFEVMNFSKFTTRQSVSEYIAENTEASSDPRILTIQEDIMPYVVAEPLYAWEINAAVIDAMSTAAIENSSEDWIIEELINNINTYVTDNELAGKNPKAQ